MLATPHDRIPDISSLASLLADPGRALMLLLLQDGRLYPASDLAQAAGLSPQAASNHLAKLLHGQAVRVEQRGRHRYYGLASPAIAHALEALSAAAGHHAAVRPKGNADIRLARSCYDHLAGRLGIVVADFLQQQQLLQRREEREFAVTPAGSDWLAARLDIQLDGIARPRRPLARRGPAWTGANAATTSPAAWARRPAPGLFAARPDRAPQRQPRLADHAGRLRLLEAGMRSGQRAATGRVRGIKVGIAGRRYPRGGGQRLRRRMRRKRASSLSRCPSAR
ncbi:ArsR family transcriptional regulator [Chromobacterium haemolyticum]|nr:ArsR family transcriptional regulator [Chromobacterium haemolyticum]